MDKYTIKGTKKLLSLSRTKIRLAEEAETIECKPKPLPLIKLLSGVEINTVADAKEYRESLVKNLNTIDPRNVANTVLQSMDLIEGVKYKFEPQKFLANIDEDKLREIEEEARKKSLPVNILLMTKKAPEGLNIYIGYEPPEGVIFLSAVPTTLAFFLNYAFNSNHFTLNMKLRNIKSFLGHKTLILNAIHHSMGEYGAELHEME
ncbi:MAG: hypothetical protein U9Q22_02765 [Candidatus Altiarchaeota archaeon]|nr:hypothetical protein [Candidatus Altiarchaeota archaeon]